jgi:hypothetical protein
MMNWVLLNAVGAGSIAWFSFVSDDSNFILLNCTPFCTQFRGSDIALPRLLGVKNFFMQLRFERFTENLLFCPLLAHEVLKKTFGYSGLLLKCHEQQHVGRNCEVTG